MKLWLDDERPAPEGWTWVMDYYTMIETLQDHAEEIEVISLDHDLGLYEGNQREGYDVVKWIAANDAWPSILGVHSANPVGIDNMIAMIENQGPYSEKDFVTFGNNWVGWAYHNGELY